MKLTSPAFADGEAMPTRYTADDDNHSPPLVFSDIPKNTRSLALTMEDIDSGFIHWVMFDMDPLITGLAQAEIAGRYRDGLNGFRELGYTGPHALDGEHRYRFTLYALDTRLGLTNGIELRQLKAAMAGHVLATAELATKHQCTGKLPAAPLERSHAPVNSSRG